jgi:subtilase family serine protease
LNTFPPVVFNPDATTFGVPGLSPAQVRHAYGFDQVTADGSGQTIAIVDAYHDPTIANDLRVFDQTFGLPDPPSFVQRWVPGTRTDVGWSAETALDVEWAHAIAPQANLLLQEAASSSLGDLLTAVDQARQHPGVVAVSISWGGSEFSSETSYDRYFTTPAGHIGGSDLPGGITFVAASGDSGAWSGVQWPAASPNVLAVGGTRLVTDSHGNYRGEVGWYGSTGGFSNYEPEPAYQQRVQNTGVRTTPDVAYNADPRSGYAVYDSAGGRGVWSAVGGTSAGAPQWAGLLALVDQSRALTGQGSVANAQASIYNLTSTDFNTVTRGSNGYAAGPGYNLVTGLGTPRANQLVSQAAADPPAAATTPSRSSGTTQATGRTNPPVFIIFLATDPNLFLATAGSQAAANTSQSSSGTQSRTTDAGFLASLSAPTPIGGLARVVQTSPGYVGSNDLAPVGLGGAPGDGLVPLDNDNQQKRTTPTALPSGVPGTEQTGAAAGALTPEAVDAFFAGSADMLWFPGLSEESGVGFEESGVPQVPVEALGAFIFVAGGYWVGLGDEPDSREGRRFAKLRV